MAVTLLGHKLGMTQIYQEDGIVIPVTVLQVGPCTVLQVRTQDVDGYDAIQLGYADKPRRVATKAERGHVAKVKTEPKRYVKEVRLSAPSEHSAGDVLTVDIFDGVAAVDVIGTSKGRGFSGQMKRHNFSGQRASHGVKRCHRKGGSIGQSADPARVFKGTKMAGRYGGVRSTVRNMVLARIDSEQGLLLVRGGVPGPNGGFVMVRTTNRFG